jgi:HEAT repeat protein
VVMWAGAAVGATGVESLFFARFGPENLPFMFIALGLITLPTTLALAGLLGRSDPARVLTFLPLAMAVVAVVMRTALLAPGTWPFPVLWLAMMVLWIVQGIQGWGVAGMVHDARQAKRLFPLYGAGLILGGAVGGLVTAPLAVLVGAENLLLVWAVSLGATAVLTRRVLAAAGRRPRPRRARRASDAGLLSGILRGAGVVRRSSLLRWMSVSMALLTLLMYSLSLPFAEAVTGRFPEADRLAAFLGVFQGVVYLVALVVSVTLANRLFARLGVATTVLTFPVLYTVGFLGVAVWPAFGALVAFRFAQLLWMSGVWQTAWQAMFNVVPPEQRERARAFIDGGPMQAGIVAAGAFLLLAQATMTQRQLFLVAAATAAVAVVAAHRARRAYGGAVADALRAGWPEVFVPEEDPFGGAPWDRAALDALATGARDPDPGTRRIVMEILADVPLPEARALRLHGLEDEDPGVRAAALSALARSPDPAAAPAAGRALGDPDARVRAAAVDAAAVCVLADQEAIRALRPLLEDPEPTVRLRAAVSFHRRSADEDDAADDVLRRMAGSADPEERAAALAALGELGEEPALVAAGLSDPEPSVRCAASTALSRFGLERAADDLLGTLADEDPMVRETAAVALAGLGPGVAPALYRGLEDDERVEGALTALARLPVGDRAPIRHAAEAHRALALRWHGEWRLLAGSTDERVQLLAFSVRYRALRHAALVLRAEAVTGDRAAIGMALEHLAAEDQARRANALELIESVGDPELLRPLFPVWDPEPDPGADIAGSVWRMMREEDPWVRAAAEMAATAIGGGGRPREADVETLATVTLMDRALALRKVPLFRVLSPPDLKRVAESALEHVYPDGAEIARRGEPGDALHVVVTGEVRVLGGDGSDGDVEITRLGPGYIVGEMAILSDEPRMGTLVAAGEVRTLSIDRARFQRILRERPDAALAVMRELCARLRVASLRPTEGAPG